MKSLYVQLKLRHDTYLVSSLHFALQIVTALSNFVITPLLINRLGLNSYALWVTVNAFSGLLLLADWGFLNTFRVNMTKIYIQERVFVHEIWKKAILYMNCSAGVAVCFLILSIPNSPWSTILWQDQNLAIFGIGILIAYLTLFEHLFLVKSQILESELKSTAIVVIFRFLEGITQVLALVINPSVHRIFLISLIFRFVSLVSIAKSAPRYLQTSVSNNIYRISIGGVLKESVGSSMFVLSNVLYSNVFTLILTKILTVELLAVVQVSRLLVSPIRILGSSIALGTLQSQLQRNFRTLENLPKLVPRIQPQFFYLLLLSTAFVSIFASQIWKILFPDVIGFNQTLIIIFAVQYLFDSMIWLNSRDFYNKNRLLRLGLINLLLSTFAILSIPFSYNHFDILGVPFPLLIFDIIFLSMLSSKKGKKWLFQ